jgi:hypothetical protein
MAKVICMGRLSLARWHNQYILSDLLALLSGLWLLVMRTRVFGLQLDVWFLLYQDLFSRTKRTEQAYSHISQAPYVTPTGYHPSKRHALFIPA